jgi:hypothetical protein
LKAGGAIFARKSRAAGRHENQQQGVSYNLLMMFSQEFYPSDSVILILHGICTNKCYGRSIALEVFRVFVKGRYF